MKAVLLSLVLATSPLVCWAGATLTMGFGSDSDCNTADNCAYAPNVGLSESLSVHQNGSQDVPPPILLILGVLNDLPLTFPPATLSAWSSFDPAHPGSPDRTCSTDSDASAACYQTSGTTAIGSDTNFVLGYRGAYTGGSRGDLDIYSFLGLAGGNNSNHFNNWAGFLADQYNVTAQKFGIYVVALHTTLEGSGLLELDFGTLIPEFTYFAGYAVNSDGRNTKYFSSPFTRTGLSVPVSEPPYVSLLSWDIVLLGVAVFALTRYGKLGRKIA